MKQRLLSFRLIVTSDMGEGTEVKQIDLSTDDLDDPSDEYVRGLAVGLMWSLFDPSRRRKMTGAERSMAARAARQRAAQKARGAQ